ncbi:hypothetical protein U1Q18_043251 [Sarracenia purpurea var. burkii]
MEGKVETVLKLIEEDGDSFAKRAEMYYEKRPELINFVQESYRAYRSLAERYDRISTELQNANTTIAAVFPDKVQFASTDDEDDIASTKIPKNNATKAPKFRRRDSKGIVRSASEKLQGKKSSKSANSNASVWKSSGLSKFEVVEEIDKVEKEILALQTVKEFVKSSYEIGITKYREIEDRISELQDKVLSLQDEFRVGKLIEDGEARALMVEAALKSCEEALAQLQEKQERPTEETIAEFQRVEDACEKLKSLRHKFGKLNEEDESAKAGEKLELIGLREKIAEHFDVGSKELLVSKVSSLENTVSSQTALIDRLRTETSDLQTQIRSLEDYKAALIDDSNTLTNRLKEMAEKCQGLQDLNQKLESQNQNNEIQEHFTEAKSSLDQKLEEEFSIGVRTPEEMEKRELESEIVVEREIERVLSLSINEQEEEKEEKVSEGRSNVDSDSISEKREDPNSLDKVDKQGVRKKTVNEPKKAAMEKAEALEWQEMLLDGLEDKEKFLLTDYITILKNYKELRKKHNDAETEHRDRVFETMVQLRELRSTIAMKDKEIQSMRRKLDLVQRNLNDQNAKHDAFNQEVLKVNEALGLPPAKKEEEEEEEKLILIDRSRSVSSMEENLRTKTNVLLDKNLDMWLRFSASFHQIQKFKTRFRDSQAEISKLEEKGNSNPEGIARADIKSDLRSVHKNLREMLIELKLWIKQSGALKDEFQRRYSSLCSIQEEITKALMAGSKGEEEEEEMKFTSHEAAKFEGEILNMKHENKKVRDELQASLDHATVLQQEVDKTLAKLSDEIGISQLKNDNPPQIRRSGSRVRVPLRSFIFGTKVAKPKKKSSFFSFMYRRKYHGPRAGPPM